MSRRIEIATAAALALGVVGCGPEDRSAAPTPIPVPTHARTVEDDKALLLRETTPNSIRLFSLRLELWLAEQADNDIYETHVINHKPRRSHNDSSRWGIGIVVNDPVYPYASYDRTRWLFGRLHMLTVMDAVPYVTDETGHKYYTLETLQVAADYGISPLDGISTMSRKIDEARQAGLRVFDEPGQIDLPDEYWERYIVPILGVVQHDELERYGVDTHDPDAIVEDLVPLYDVMFYVPNEPSQ